VLRFNDHSQLSQHILIRVFHHDCYNVNLFLAFKRVSCGPSPCACMNFVEVLGKGVPRMGSAGNGACPCSRKLRCASWKKCTFYAGCEIHAPITDRITDGVEPDRHMGLSPMNVRNHKTIRLSTDEPHHMNPTTLKICTQSKPPVRGSSI